MVSERCGGFISVWSFSTGFHSLLTLDRLAQMRSMSWVRVAVRFSIGVPPTWSRMTKRIKVFSCSLHVRESSISGWHGMDALGLLAIRSTSEECQVDLKYRLQQSHIRALIQSNLMLPSLSAPTNHDHSPEINKQDFRARQAEQRGFPLEILILALLPPIRSFDIHDERA